MVSEGSASRDWVKSAVVVKEGDPSGAVRLGREGLEFGAGHLLGGGVDGLSVGEDAEFQVALWPLVVLLGLDGAKESDDAGSVGKSRSCWCGGGSLG